MSAYHSVFRQAPTQAAVEMSQCIAQAVAPKTASGGTRKTESQTALLQLPHVTPEVIRKLGRKKVKQLKDLQELPREQQSEVLQEGGLTAEECQEAMKFLEILPSVVGRGHFFVDGEEGIKDSDLITCRVGQEGLWVVAPGSGSCSAPLNPKTSHCLLTMASL